MKIYLIEIYQPEIEYDEGSLVIGLTPMVCYQLQKAGIKHSIIEDYYDQVELAASEDDYHASQLQWFKGLDTFLQETIDEVKVSDLKLGTTYYQFLRIAVLDPIYLRCYTLSKLFAAVSPTAVTFVSRTPEEASLDYSLFNNGRSYYSLITEVLCKQSNINMESVFLEPDAEKSTGVTHRHESLPTRLKRVLAKSSLVKKVYFFPGKLRFYCRRFKACLFAKETGQKRHNILLLKLSHIGEAFVIEALSRGYRVYQLSGNDIIRHSCFGNRKFRNLKAKNAVISIAYNNIWEKAANVLEDHELIKQFNQICQSDVSRIVLPDLKYFISDVCPVIFHYYQALSLFYRKEKIDIVITPHEVFPAEFAAIAAARKSHRVTSVDLQHGDSAFAANFWDIIWSSRFDIDITSNEETKEYFSNRCQIKHYPCKIYNSPHRLLPVKRTALSRKTRGNTEKNRITYLPTMFVGEHSRFDCAHYPDTWYYKFQQALIEYFSTRKEYTFVWKGLPTSDAVYNPIPDFIKDNNYTNIEIATNPFTQHMHTADRVICDYPSTGFYESVVAGIATISLYHRALKVRESAIDYFGKLLVPFSDVSEAITHIDEFLRSDPEQYKTTIDLEGQSILDILEEVSREEAK